MKIKTKDLVGPVLNFAAFIAAGHSYWLRSFAVWDSNHGYTDWILDRGGLNRYSFDGSRSRAGHWEVVETYSPSTDWSQGGPIIERERIQLNNGTPPGREFMWHATVHGWHRHVHAQMSGPTPLIAAMRCFVASKLGDEVDVPEELTS